MKSQIQISNWAKFCDPRSNGSAVRAQTDRHTDRTDFVPSTAEAGGNETSGPFQMDALVDHRQTTHAASQIEKFHLFFSYISTHAQRKGYIVGVDTFFFTLGSCPAELYFANDCQP